MTEPVSEPSAAIRTLTSISEIADRYDGFIVDLWGVVHDGITPYPGVVDALTTLRAQGKKVGLLSNAPRRVEAVAEKLDLMGVPRSAWDVMLTSGEASRQALIDRPDPEHGALGTVGFLIGGEMDGDVLDDVPGLSRTDRLDEASFVLVTGIDDDDRVLEDYEEILGQVRELRLPMLCANPDLVVVSGTELKLCAGSIAVRYQEMGGAVLYHGKPHPPVYHRLRREMGNPARLLAIGDAFRTDIAGASAIGIDGLLITGGIHAVDLEAPLGTPDPDLIAEAAAATGFRPTYAMHRLV